MKLIGRRTRIALGTGAVVVLAGTGVAHADKTTYSSGAVREPIPDLGTAVAKIKVNDPGKIKDLNVLMRVNHTFDSDLDFTLFHKDPIGDNEQLPIVHDVGGGGNNFGTGRNSCRGTPTRLDDEATTDIDQASAPFAGTFQPQNLLQNFEETGGIQIPMRGTWKLIATDDEAGAMGKLGCFKLRIKHT